MSETMPRELPIVAAPRRRRVSWRPPKDLLAAMVLYLAIVALQIIEVLGRTGGRLAYALDDGYIHMSLARHLVEDGVWGATADTWAGAGTSLVWPLLLAPLYVLGPWDWAPLLLNAAFSVGSLWYAWRLLTAAALGPMARGLVLAALVLLTPLATLTLEGMEHTLQILVSLWLLDAASKFLAADPASPVPRGLLVACALSTATRYEGAFFVALATGLLVLQSRRLASALVAGAGAAPIALYGVLSLAGGGQFLPNSAVVKAPSGWVSPFSDPFIFFLREPFYVFRHNEHLFVLMLAALAIVALRSGRERPTVDSYRLLIVAAACYLQFTFARPGWGFRYEAWLVFLCLLCVACALGDRWMRAPSHAARKGIPALMAALLLGSVVAYPLGVRAYDAWEWTPRAAENMHDQPVMAAFFLREHYPGASIAILDLGALSYYEDMRILDLTGLGDNQVSRESPHHWLPPERIGQLAMERGVSIAILGKTRPEVGGGLPASWIEVGAWRLAHNVASGQETLSFFAVQPSEESPLKDKLRAFAPTLPARVEQSGAYTQEP